jgi:MFS family permease
MMGSDLNMQLGTTGCSATSQLDAEPSIVAEGAPSVPFLSFCVFSAGVGLWLADVMGDSIVAEKAKLEPIECRGSVQSSCYSFRFFGSMIAVPMGTFLYSTMGPKYMVLILSLLPLAIIPFVITFKEVKDVPVAPVPEQCQEIFNTVCSRAVWQPMGFVYLYNILQVGNSAWKQFLRTNLGFTACQLNMMLISAYILIYLGVLTYKYFMIKWSWRNVYIVTTLLSKHCNSSPRKPRIVLFSSL